MNTATFFEKFALLADSPAAVSRMREMVLELALQGKLSEQRAEDADGPEWLEVTRRMDAEGGPERAAADSPFEIPSSWRWTTLDSLGDTKPRNNVSDNAKTSFVPMTLIPAEFGQVAKHEVRPWTDIKKGYTHFQDGDVVMAKITPCFENGKSAIMEGLTGGVGAGTTELHVFRGNGAPVLPRFVIIHLKSCGFITRGVPRMTGSAGQKRVPYDYFAGSPFPLPPLAEQMRIVAKVDELMALCDQLQAQQQEQEARHAVLAQASLARFAEAPTPGNLQFLFHKSYDIAPAELRRSILTLAVQGKLVPQDSSDSPAEERLTKVLVDRTRQDKALRIKAPSPVLGDDEYRGTLPVGWCYASPDQVTAFHRNALAIGPFGSSLLKSDYTNAGVSLVFVRDIRRESFGGPDTRFVSAQKAEELASHKVVPGDVLITKMGDPPGDTAIYPERRPPAIITADCIKLTPHLAVVLAEYLRIMIRAPQIARQFAGITLGVAQQKVSLGRFRCIALPIPPLAEQRRIVAKVDALMALVDSLEAQLHESKGKGAELLEAVVAELTAAA